MYELDLHLSDQLTILLTATLASIGTAPVLGGYRDADYCFDQFIYPRRGPRRFSVSTELSIYVGQL